MFNFKLKFMCANQASAERRDLVPERCRSWSFQVVPGTSTTKNHIWNGTTRNKERQISKKMGTRENIWNEVVPGTRSFLGTSTAQERDFLSENDLVPERAYEFQSGGRLQWYRKIYRRFPYDFQTRIFRIIGRSTGDSPLIFRLESSELYRGVPH